MEDRFEFLVGLLGRYEQEAEKSAGAGAYLAGCVMLGSALEGYLLAMTECFREEVERSTSVPRDKHGKLISPYRWDLWQLLDVARELGWLPATLPVNEDMEFEEALEKGDIGDFVEVVREIRNLVHPGKHVRTYPGITVAEEHFQDCYTLVAHAVVHLRKHLIGEIDKGLEKSDEQLG